MGLLFQGFKEAARLKHLDPLDISNNYQCPIYVYEAYENGLSTYLLSSSPIDVVSVIQWVKQQQKQQVSEYIVRLNEVQSGWFSTTKSVFITDVRYTYNAGCSTIEESLNHVDNGELKLDGDSLLPFLKDLNNGVLAFNYHPDYPGTEQQIERDCSQIFKRHAQSVKWRSSINENPIVTECKMYGITKYEQSSGNVLLILRPIIKTDSRSLFLHLENLTFKSFQCIMYNADQFLLNMNDEFHIYNDEDSNYCAISEFKEKLLSSNIIDSEEDDVGNYKFINIPLVRKFGMKDSINEFCFIFSTTANIDTLELIDKNNLPQEIKISYHEFFKDLDSENLIIALGESCSDFEKFHEAYSESHSNDELELYRSKGLYINPGLSNDEWTDEFTTMMPRYRMKTNDLNYKLENHSLSMIKIPRYNNPQDFEIVLIIKHVDLDMQSIMYKLLRNTSTLPRYYKRSYNRFRFLEFINR